MSVFETANVHDVKVVDLPQAVDDRGSLIEVLRTNDGGPVPGDGDHAVADVIRQVYLVHNPMPTVRAYHAHKSLVDYFSIVRGSAIFAFGTGEVENENGEPVFYGMRGMKRVVCSARKPQMIVVPAGVFHGWKSLEPDTMMVSIGSTRYNVENPDEVRIPPYSLDYFYSSGSVWDVVEK